MVADWEISELSNDCFGRARSMVSGATMLFFRTSRQGITAFISNPKWEMTPGNQSAVDVWIDAKPVGRYPAKVFDNSVVEIDIPTSIIPRLQDGAAVEMDFERARYKFPLKYSRKGLATLVDCYARKAAAVATVPLPRQPHQERGPLLATGSGFFVDRLGHLITNDHVVDGCPALRVAQYGPARLIRRDPQNDIALLKVEAAPAGHARVRASDLDQAQKILVVGYPLSDLLGGSMNVTTGIVSSLTGINGDSRYVQISAAVQAGNSSGPLIDENGDVAGVVTAKINARVAERVLGTMPENIAWALRISLIVQFLKINDIRYEVATGSTPKSDQESTKAAASFTVLVQCVR